MFKSGWCVVWDNRSPWSMQDNWVTPKQRLNTYCWYLKQWSCFHPKQHYHIFGHITTLFLKYDVYHYSWAIHSVSHQTKTLHLAWLWWFYSFYVCINLWRVEVDTVRWLIVSAIIASPLPQFEKVLRYQKHAMTTLSTFITQYTSIPKTTCTCKFKEVDSYASGLNTICSCIPTRSINRVKSKGPDDAGFS